MYFTFDFPGPTSSIGTCEVYDEVERRAITAPPDTIVYLVFQGPPMGWSWPLFFCNAITESCLREGLGRALGVRPADVPMLSARTPTRALRHRQLAAGPYVDNATIFASPGELAQAFLDCALAVFEERGLRYREVAPPGKVVICCGVQFDFGSRRALPTRECAWRLRGALTDPPRHEVAARLGPWGARSATSSIT